MLWALQLSPRYCLQRNFSNVLNALFIDPFLKDANSLTNIFLSGYVLILFVEKSYLCHNRLFFCIDEIEADIKH